MKKQKICIIGGGLTGLITALVLSKLNLDVDLDVNVDVDLDVVKKFTNFRMVMEHLMLMMNWQ